MIIGKSTIIQSVYMRSLRSAIILAILVIGMSAHAQSVTGKWYGVGNANVDGVNNNYLIEMILEQNGNTVSGEFNYYFKNGYFPNKISGKYDSKTRRLQINTTPITYYRSSAVNGVECNMTGEFTLLVSKTGNSLRGKFSSSEFYALTCPAISMNLNPAKEDKQQDEIMVSEKDLGVKGEQQINTALPVVPVAFKEQSTAEKQFPQRRNVDLGTLEVDSTELTIELIDNGEIDRDSVSLFFNNHQIANRQELTKKPLTYRISLDMTKPYNELSMFAENLGIIPPNTAVLIVYDGKKRYEASITSTLQTNGTIRIRKRETAP